MYTFIQFIMRAQHTLCTLRSFSNVRHARGACIRSVWISLLLLPLAIAFVYSICSPCACVCVHLYLLCHLTICQVVMRAYAKVVLIAAHSICVCVSSFCLAIMNSLFTQLNSFVPPASNSQCQLMNMQFTPRKINGREFMRTLMN